MPLRCIIYATRSPGDSGLSLSRIVINEKTNHRGFCQMGQVSSVYNPADLYSGFSAGKQQNQDFSIW